MYRNTPISIAGNRSVIKRLLLRAFENDWWSQKLPPENWGLLWYCRRCCNNVLIYSIYYVYKNRTNYTLTNNRIITITSQAQLIVSWLSHFIACIIVQLYHIYRYIIVQLHSKGSTIECNRPLCKQNNINTRTSKKQPQTPTTFERRVVRDDDPSSIEIVVLPPKTIPHK